MERRSFNWNGSILLWWSRLAPLDCGKFRWRGALAGWRERQPHNQCVPVSSRSGSADHAATAPGRLTWGVGPRRCRSLTSTQPRSTRGPPARATGRRTRRRRACRGRRPLSVSSAPRVTSRRPRRWAAAPVSGSHYPVMARCSRSRRNAWTRRRRRRRRMYWRSTATPAGTLSPRARTPAGRGHHSPSLQTSVSRTSGRPATRDMWPPWTPTMTSICQCPRGQVEGRRRSPARPPPPVHRLKASWFGSTR